MPFCDTEECSRPRPTPLPPPLSRTAARRRAAACNRCPRVRIEESRCSALAAPRWKRRTGGRMHCSSSCGPACLPLSPPSHASPCRAVWPPHPLLLHAATLCPSPFPPRLRNTALSRLHPFPTTHADAPYALQSSIGQLPPPTCGSVPPPSARDTAAAEPRISLFVFSHSPLPPPARLSLSLSSVHRALPLPPFPSVVSLTRVSTALARD